MSKRKSDESDMSDTLLPSEPVLVKKEVPVVVKQLPPRRVSFEQWARARNIKPQHQGGMKAFVSNVNQPRSYEAWDKEFSDY